MIEARKTARRLERELAEARAISEDLFKRYDEKLQSEFELNKDVKRLHDRYRILLNDYNAVSDRLEELVRERDEARKGRE
jgi:hypothetical protein